MTGRLLIADIRPVVAGGAHPAKAVVGEPVPVAATVVGEAHAAVGCHVVWHDPDGLPRAPVRMTPGAPGTDTWHAEISPDAVGPWTFAVEAFTDPYRQWRDAVAVKADAGQGADELANDLAEGAALLERAARQLPPADATDVRAAASALADQERPLPDRLEPAFALAPVLWRQPVRDLVTRSPDYRLWTDRQRALFSAWYEFFPRSEGAVVDEHGRPVRHGTFATAARRLPEIAAMGFDVVYLPPIHPIGQVGRKGRNNALVAADGDVGSPWAIGSADGGHDAVHPQLGTVDDFREFVAQAHGHGLEVALDLALQCAPDHPWVTAHPEWFTHRPDGSIAYAENPPKKYQDIYPLNFDRDPAGLRREILRVVRHWIAQGVTIFRVDNPHTKPPDLWQWLIATVQRDHPQVLFLAEAFTRPALVHGLARLGFSQSYTYFAWRTTAAELRAYGEEMVAAADYLRPNFWPNTPDILTAQLQQGGPPVFRIRAVLAALLSPSWGIYAGYELAEHKARPGAEEYLDNEKYQLRPRDWRAAEAAGTSLAPYLARLNALRRELPALQWLRTLRFHDVDTDAMLCWSKRDPHGGGAVLVVCLLDPHQPHWGHVTVDLPALGLADGDRYTVRDQLTGAEYEWGGHNPVWLDPRTEPAHVFTVHPPG